MNSQSVNEDSMPGQYSKGKTRPTHIHALHLPTRRSSAPPFPGLAQLHFQDQFAKQSAAGVARCSSTPLDWVFTIYQQASPSIFVSEFAIHLALVLPEGRINPNFPISAAWRDVNPSL